MKMHENIVIIKLVIKWSVKGILNPDGYAYCIGCSRGSLHHVLVLQLFYFAVSHVILIL